MIVASAFSSTGISVSSSPYFVTMTILKGNIGPPVFTSDLKQGMVVTAGIKTLYKLPSTSDPDSDEIMTFIDLSKTRQFLSFTDG